ncbi:GNAT family N-acetyltransferase [Chengkuizengella axinellae]|uniref:GNAT family N-acetyltransferase n=1 Tax=Chengkuizengella axinellae TaxID=3064388 RepID=A0ABT9IY31_9BACL|nr:GNAT family N-acetyltransferase [Chengkuizengella sp. 2205SS18-9]MDP5274270.1 GNAT family N-acetyltransferase [Chengkuizengella sp. 2205SS18-9]
MEHKLKRLSEKNLNESTKLYINVFNGEPWNDGWKEEDARERLSDLFFHQRFWGIGIYDRENNIVGFILGYTQKWLDQYHFYLNEMCVKQPLQGKGIGAKLLASLEIHCNKNNINRIYLLTARVGQAEAFYKKNGYYVSPKMIMMSKRLENI